MVKTEGRSRGAIPVGKLKEDTGNHPIKQELSFCKRQMRLGAGISGFWLRPLWLWASTQFFLAPGFYFQKLKLFGKIFIVFQKSSTYILWVYGSMNQSRWRNGVLWWVRSSFSSIETQSRNLQQNLYFPDLHTSGVNPDPLKYKTQITHHLAYYLRSCSIFFILW